MDRSKWVLVPRESTDDMHSAYIAAKYDGPKPTLIPDLWRAMLAAAPPPPAEQASGEIPLIGTLADLPEHVRKCVVAYGDARARAALSQRPVVDRQPWRPMDTAPRDGTRFLARAASGKMRVDYRDPRQGEWKGSNKQFWMEKPDDRYVAWQPLPPVEDGEQS